MYNSKLDCYCTLPDEELQNVLGMLQNWTMGSTASLSRRSDSVLLSWCCEGLAVEQSLPHFHACLPAFHCLQYGKV